MKTLPKIAEAAVKRKAMIGFDGYIDEMFRVVERSNGTDTPIFYQDIPSFAARVAAAAGKSADIEIVPTDKKLGGNAPIMANALSRLGVTTVCIGAMGHPKLDSAFAEMSQICQCISLCDPAPTTALEFSDGKVMFANAQPLLQLNWERIKELLGLERLQSLFCEADLIALVNWSGVPDTEAIWAGIHREVLPALRGTNRTFFFDLADPTKKSRNEIERILKLICSFSPFGRVILGLNENEALKIHAALFGQECSTEEAVQSLYDQLQIHALIVHPIDRCIAATADGLSVEYGSVVKHPRLSTGGGDNFNAGFCLGQLLGWSIPDSTVLGMKVSGFYVGNGYSPTLAQLNEALD